MLKAGTYVLYSLAPYAWDQFVDWVCYRKEVFCYQGKQGDKRYPTNLFPLSDLSLHYNLHLCLAIVTKNSFDRGKRGSWETS